MKILIDWDVNVDNGSEFVDLKDLGYTKNE